jgi:alkylhydroperoxidase/carboxymuconolactone decarboxylase family protein YurZ
MTSALSERKKQLRDEFIESRGYWNEIWNGLLELDEEFFEAYTRLSSVPWKSGPLEPKVKEFVYIAMNAAATHMYEPGVRQHVRQALQLGGTAAEIMEVLELTATLGIHACTVGVPILVEELEAAGQPLSRELTQRMQEVKADFESKRGYWNAFWDEMLLLDPEFFDAYTQFSGVPWVSGVLEPKVKELIYTAFDVAATHLYTPGLRQHIRNALGYGATREEVLEVIELVSVLGIHACTVGVPILVEEVAAASGNGGA